MVVSYVQQAKGLHVMLIFWIEMATTLFEMLDLEGFKESLKCR
jgi:hypothetical protein